MPPTIGLHSKQSSKLFNLSSQENNHIKRKCNARSMPAFLNPRKPMIDKKEFDEALKEHEQKVNVIIRKKQSKIKLSQYLCAVCLLPVPSTFIRAIKNNHFVTWLDLTAELIHYYLPKIIPVIRGHLKSEK